MEDRLSRSSIYRVPAKVVDSNKEACRSQLVSFGPYHHGEENVKLMEEHKKRALLQFVKRSRKPLQLFIDTVTEVVQCLKDSYHELDVL
ncbi:hypothetical protein RCOM_1528610 [Ricinus communis]|uniref:Uncharacterized protein n=1 Tax=Ricinus communis TaxID=3988 RepID=B9RHK4_RICCO|nr:hypothetical protein RCOM_1528610 [Ricinus communis]